MFFTSKLRVEMMAISLCNHVTYCHVGDVVIFLNVAQNRYTYLGNDTTQGIKILEGYSNEQNLGRSFDIEILEIVNDLTKRGLTTESTSPRFSPFIRKRPSSSVQDVYWPQNLHLQRLLNFFYFYIVASKLLKSKTLADIIATTKSKKSQQMASRQFPDRTAVRELSRQYIDARPFVYSHHNKCLLDSLIFFLLFSSHRVKVDWVFGVGTSPFRAHCWIEYEGIVLNDTSERTHAYTPIFAV